MEDRYLLFSRNYPYAMGGAEQSLYTESSLKYRNSNVIYPIQKTALPFVKNLNDVHDNVTGLDCFNLYQRFFYYEYLANKKIISTVLEEYKDSYDVVVTQNRWAPAIINSASLLQKESVYYLRDETSIGIINNYYTGYKSLLKKIYSNIEYPAMLQYFKDNIIALNSASVISNSNYIANSLYDKYKIDSTVVYPKICHETLRLSYINNLSDSIVQGVVLVGDTLIKGIDIFIKLATLFPHVEFYAFGKGRLPKAAPTNVHHMGWTNDLGLPYAYAKVVLVPSVIAEAYGRVAAECQSLDVPVLVSNIGGLPEAVNYDSDKIANDFSEFVTKLRVIL